MSLSIYGGISMFKTLIFSFPVDFSKIVIKYLKDIILRKRLWLLKATNLYGISFSDKFMTKIRATFQQFDDDLFDLRICFK